MLCFDKGKILSYNAVHHLAKTQSMTQKHEILRPTDTGFDKRMEDVASDVVAAMLGYGFTNAVGDKQYDTPKTTDLNTNLPDDTWRSLMKENTDAEAQLASLRDILITADEIKASRLIRPTAEHLHKIQMSSTDASDPKTAFTTPYGRDLLYNIALGLAGTGVAKEEITGKSISDTIERVKTEAIGLRRTPTVLGPRCTTGDVIFGVLTGRITLRLTPQIKKVEFLKKP